MSLSDLLSVIISRSIHVAANGFTPFFFMAEYYSTVHMHRVFFIHSSVDGHFGCFVSCLAHLSLKEVVHDPCARCPKGRENSAVTRPSLDSRRCEIDIEDLQRRRSVSREVGVENRKGTCFREDRERGILGTGGS